MQSLKNEHIVDRMMTNIKVMKQHINLNIESVIVETDDKPDVVIKQVPNNRGDYDIKKFKNKLKTYHDSKNSKKGFMEEKPINISVINDFNEIDTLDKGKPWKRLDAWMKLKCLKEYAIKSNKSEDYQTLIVKLFNSGEFKSTSEVNYNSTLGIINSLSSSKLSILESNLK